MKVVVKSFTFLSSPLPPTVKIPLDRVQDAWAKSSGPFQIKRLADHYGIFTDLFHMAYFLPQVPLHICYSQENAAHVNYGNRLTPTEVRLRSTSLFLSPNICISFICVMFGSALFTPSCQFCFLVVNLCFLYLGSICPPGQLRSRGGFPLDPAAHQSRSAFPQCTASHPQDLQRPSVHNSK